MVEELVAVESACNAALVPLHARLRAAAVDRALCEIVCTEASATFRCVGAFGPTTPEAAQLAYTEALAQLRQHPPIFWTRNNFFLLVQSGLLAAATKQDFLTPGLQAWVTYLAGTFVAIIWLWVTWAGRELQRDWRKIVRRLEPAAVGGAGPFSVSSGSGEGTRLRISITTAVVVLAAGFVFLWLLVMGHAAFVSRTASTAAPPPSRAAADPRDAGLARDAAATRAK